MKKIWVYKYIMFMVVGLLLLSAGFSLGGGFSEAKGSAASAIDVRGYVNHDVIIINDDTELANIASQEGWQGDGSSGNPYIIENYDIDATGEPVGIYLGNTTKYVTIRNVYIHDAHMVYSASYYYKEGAAIKLYNAQNVVIESSNLSGNDYGIYVKGASNIVIMNNHFEGNRRNSIDTGTSSDLKIWSNEMLGESLSIFGSRTEIGSFEISTNNTVNGKPVYFYTSKNFNNLTVPSDAGAVIVNGASYLRMNNLKIYHSSSAIQVFYSNHIYITNLTIGDMKQEGIFEYWSNNVSIYHSRIYDIWGEGIFLYMGSHNTVENNEFYGISGYNYAIEVREDYSEVKENYIHDSPYGSGVLVSFGTGNRIDNNLIVSNRYGIKVGYIQDSVHNTTISYNTICNSSYYGITLKKGDGHRIFGNILCYNNGATSTYDPNHVQAEDDVGAIWNNSIGNFWLDWAANNFTNDGNHDGYVDYNYTIAGSAGSVDANPLKYSSPAIPGNFVARAGDGYVNLTWNSPLSWGLISPQEYRVYRDGVQIATLNPSTTYYNDTSVQDGQYYLYYVEAVNSKGWVSKPTIERYAVPWGVKYISRDSVIINNDAELRNFISSENLKGSGTAWDPYIISGYDINGSAKNVGIYIGNTTLYFVIRDCYLHDATGYSTHIGYGVNLYNVTNGSIAGNVFDNNERSVYIGEPYSKPSRNIVIWDNIITSHGYYYSGIMLWNAMNIDVENNTINGVGIDIQGNSSYWGTYTITSDNTVNGKPVYYFANRNYYYMRFSEDAGEIIVVNASYLKIENVNMDGYGSNILLLNSSGVYVYNSSLNRGEIKSDRSRQVHIVNNTLNGGDIMLLSTSSGIIERNRVINSRYGMYLSGSDYNIINGNYLFGQSYAGLNLWSSSYNSMTNNYIEGANTGIRIDGYGIPSEKNTITKNVIANSSSYAISIKMASSSGGGVNNTIYDNSFYYNHGSTDSYISTRVQTYDDGVGNRWNTSTKGNYWLDWANNNNTNDQQSPYGVVDWPYHIDGSAGAQDSLPLARSVPAPPSNVVARVGNRYVNISWASPVGNGSESVTAYRIYRNGSFLTSVPAGQLWYNDTDLVNGIVYTYSVSAVNSVGEGLKSNEIVAVPATIPDAPVNLVAISGDGYVNLTWELPAYNGGAEIVKFLIYRNGTLIANVSSSQLWYNDTSVTNGITYTYTVSAVNSIGESDKSDEVQATSGTAVPELGPLFGISLGILVAVYLRRKR